jgi:hypothetical protein
MWGGRAKRGWVLPGVTHICPCFPPAAQLGPSLTVSRKAKKRGSLCQVEGSLPAPLHWVSIRAASAASWQLRGLWPWLRPPSGKTSRGSSSFLGTQKWRVKEGLQNSAFCSRCCQGGGSWAGSYGPEEGSVVGGLWTRQEMVETSYKGPKRRPRHLGCRERDLGLVRQALSAG